MMAPLLFVTVSTLPVWLKRRRASHDRGIYRVRLHRAGDKAGRDGGNAEAHRRTQAELGFAGRILVAHLQTPGAETGVASLSTRISLIA
jgi:hypothetical protein